MKKVLVSDNMSEKGIEIFQNADGIEVDVKTGLSPDELKEIIGQYHGLAIRSATKVTADIIDAADNLKVVGRAGIGQLERRLERSSMRRFSAHYQACLVKQAPARID